MKINFKEIRVKPLMGNEQVLDISKHFGNFLYINTADLGMLEIAQQIYKNGIAEINEEMKEELLAILRHRDCTFAAVVKQKLIDTILESKKD